MYIINVIIFIVPSNRKRLEAGTVCGLRALAGQVSRPPSSAHLTIFSNPCSPSHQFIWCPFYLPWASTVDTQAHFSLFYLRSLLHILKFPFLFP